jgi:hypothetical protein
MSDNLRFGDHALSEKDLIRIAARRTEELRSRGYPEEWIKNDLEKLMEGVA